MAKNKMTIAPHLFTVSASLPAAIKLKLKMNRFNDSVENQHNLYWVVNSITEDINFPKDSNFKGM
jgi:hypothetical protein